MADSQAEYGGNLEQDSSAEPSALRLSERSPSPLLHALFAGVPAIYILPTHYSEEGLGELESLLITAGAPVVHQATQARLVLSKVTMPRRAKFELQIRGLATNPLEKTRESRDATLDDISTGSPNGKRRKLVGSHYAGSSQTQSLAFETGHGSFGMQARSGMELAPKLFNDQSDSNVDNPESPALGTIFAGMPGAIASPNPVFTVIRDTWLRDSLQAGRLLDVSEYMVYQGEAKKAALAQKEPTDGVESTVAYERYRADTESVIRQHASRQFQKSGGRDRTAAAATRDLAGRAFMPSHQTAAGLKRRLILQTTSEHDEMIELPDLPDWVIQNKIYSCERVAPRDSVNYKFVKLLKKIRLARVLVGDEIGVRAYSTSIASIISYPYLIDSPKEVTILPGCEQKVADLMSEYLESGHVRAADELDQDPVLSVLNEFYKIWGVGAASAREFYYERGWRDHDDIIEHGWAQLNRHQQIGLKYFDEFEQKLSRSEVEYIASVVTFHAKLLVDEDIECVIVGGYRRGKTESGDVDLIVTHPQLVKTKYLISPLVNALEQSGWITHTLILSETASARDQEPLALKGGTKSSQTRTGFDTLDKALVVWQDPNWTTRDKDLATDPQAKNPNIHRRVDIIVSPWKTVGCAVAGWTSGTTFQRDLRRYSRRVKGWKFNSSGIQDISSGNWVDLEQWGRGQGRAKSWLEAEKRVFEGLDLRWRKPEDRNTE